MIIRFSLFLTVFFPIYGFAESGPKPEEILPSEIIRRAVEAQGGKATLSKFSTISAKYEVKLFFDETVEKMAAENVFQLPSQQKTVCVWQDGRTMTRWIDRERVWMQFPNQDPQELANEPLKYQRQHVYIATARLLYPLMEDRTVQLKTIPGSKVGASSVIGVQVVFPKQDPIKLFFDIETNLLLKMETTAFDTIENKKVITEDFFSDYKEISGAKIAMSVTHVNGKMRTETICTSIEPITKKPRSFFTPATK